MGEGRKVLSALFQTAIKRTIIILVFTDLWTGCRMNKPRAEKVLLGKEETINIMIRLHYWLRTVCRKWGEILKRSSRSQSARTFGHGEYWLFGWRRDAGILLTLCSPPSNFIPRVVDDDSPLYGERKMHSKTPDKQIRVTALLFFKDGFPERWR